MDFLSCLHFRMEHTISSGGAMNASCQHCHLAAGGVGSTLLCSSLYHNLIRAFNDGDLSEARRLRKMSINMISLLGKYGGIATEAFMRYVGLDCGRFRLPVRNMTENRYTEFEKDVRNLGMDNMFSKI